MWGTECIDQHTDLVDITDGELGPGGHLGLPAEQRPEIMAVDRREPRRVGPVVRGVHPGQRGVSGVPGDVNRERQSDCNFSFSTVTIHPPLCPKAGGQWAEPTQPSPSARTPAVIAGRGAQPGPGCGNDDAGNHTLPPASLGSSGRRAGKVVEVGGGPAPIIFEEHVTRHTAMCGGMVTRRTLGI